jgi:Zn-dependent protease with chaperone function
MRVRADGVIEIMASADGSVLATAPQVVTTVSDRVGTIPRRISFPSGGLFETPDNDGIDALLAPFRGRHSGAVHRLERFGPRLAVFVVLVVAFSFALYRYAVPVLVEIAVAVTPPIVPELMSKGVLASLDQSVFEASALPAERQKALSDGFAELGALTPRGQLKVTSTGSPAYSLNFRKGGFIGPNAFALPDGTVVVTDELIELAGTDDDLILGVLAHEIGHVDHDHSLRQLYRAAGVTALIMLIGGDIGAGAEDVLVQGTAVLALSYSRNAEREADRYSVELMHRIGRDPAAIARFFEILRDKLGDKGEGDFFSTHPATPDRIEETRRYAEEVATGGDRGETGSGAVVTKGQPAAARP